MQRALAAAARHTPIRTLPLTIYRTRTTYAVTERVAPPGDGPNHRSIMSLDCDQIRPVIQTNAYVAPSATVIGSVLINDRSSILYNAVVRGDLGLIDIGAFTTIGEGCVLLCGDVVMSESYGGGSMSGGLNVNKESGMVVARGAGNMISIQPGLVVGDYCVLGSGCVLKDCHLESRIAIGERCVIEKDVFIGTGAEVEAGSVVKTGTVIKEGELWAGRPKAEFKRFLTADEIAQTGATAIELSNLGAAHSYEFLPVGTMYWEKEELARRSKNKELLEERQ